MHFALHASWQCAGNNGFHGVLCAAASGLPSGGVGTACYDRFLISSDDRPPGYTNDWDVGEFKAEYARDEYVAGVSVHPGTGAPHAALCCRR